MLNNTQASLEQFAQTLAAIVRGEISVEGWTPETARVALANLQNQSLAPVSPPPQQTGGMTTDELAAYINSYNVNPRKVSQSVRGATRVADPVIGVDMRGDQLGGYTSFADEIDSVGGRYGTYQEANKDMRSRVGSSLIADKYGKDVPEDVGRDPGAYIYNEAGTKQVRNPVKGVLRIQPLDKVQRLTDELAVNTGMKGGSLPYGVNSAYAPDQSAISLLDAYNQGLISTEDLIQGRSIDTGLTEKQAGYDEAIKAMQELDMGAIPAANRAANEALLSNLGFLRYEPRAKERLGTEFIPVTKGTGLPTAVRVDSFNRAVQQDAGASAAIADVLQGRRLGSQMPLSQIQNVMADVNALDNTVPYNTDDAADQANQRGDVFDQAARQVNTDAIKGRLNRNDYDIDAGYLDNNAEKLNLIGKRQQQIKGRIEEVLQGLGVNSLAEARQTIANNPGSQGVGQYLEGLVSEYVGYTQDAQRVGDPQDMQGMRQSVRVTDERLLGQRKDAALQLNELRKEINAAAPPELTRAPGEGWTYDELASFVPASKLRQYQSAQQELDRATQAITSAEGVDNAAFNQRVSDGGRLGFYGQGDTRNATGMQVADQLIALKGGAATDRDYRMANPRQLMVDEAKVKGNMIPIQPARPLSQEEYNAQLRLGAETDAQLRRELISMVGNDYSVNPDTAELNRLAAIENRLKGLEQQEISGGLTPELEQEQIRWQAERQSIIDGFTRKVAPSGTVQPSAMARLVGNRPNSELSLNREAYLAINPNATEEELARLGAADAQGVVSIVDQTITDTPLKLKYDFPSMDAVGSDPPVVVRDQKGKLIRVEGNQAFDWNEVDAPTGSLYGRQIADQLEAKPLTGGTSLGVSNKYAKEPVVQDTGLWGNERFVGQGVTQKGMPIELETPKEIFSPDNAFIGFKDNRLDQIDYVNGELNQNIFNYMDFMKNQIKSTEAQLSSYQPLVEERTRLNAEIELLDINRQIQDPLVSPKDRDLLVQRRDNTLNQWMKVDPQLVEIDRQLNDNSLVGSINRDQLIQERDRLVGGFLNLTNTVEPRVTYTKEGAIPLSAAVTRTKKGDIPYATGSVKLGERFAQGTRIRTPEVATTLDGTALRASGMDSRLGLINAQLSDPAIGGATRVNLLQQRDQLLASQQALLNSTTTRPSGDYITQTELPSGEPVINNSLDTESAIAIRQAQLEALMPKLQEANILKARQVAMEDEMNNLVGQLQERSQATGIPAGQVDMTNALRYQRVGEAINDRRNPDLPAPEQIKSLRLAQQEEGEKARQALETARVNRDSPATERPAKPGDNSLENRAIEYVQAEDAVERQWEQLVDQGKIPEIKEYDDMIAMNAAQLTDATTRGARTETIKRLEGNRSRLLQEKYALADQLGRQYKVAKLGQALKGPTDMPEIRAELSPEYKQFVDERLAASGGRTGVTTVIPGTTYEQQPLPTGVNTRTQELIDTTYYAPGEGEEDRVMSESYGQTRPITKADTISSLEAARASAVEDYENLKGVNKVVSKTPILKKKVVAPPSAPPPASVTPGKIQLEGMLANDARRWISAASRPGLTESLVSRVPVTALTQAAREADVIAPGRIPVASFGATAEGVEPPPSVRIPVGEALPEPPSLVSPTVAVNAPSPVVEEALNTAEEVAKRPWLARNKWLVGGAGLAAATAIGAALNQRRKEEERQRLMMMSRF